MGVAFGIAAQGRYGETIFNKVCDLEVPDVVKNGVKRAVTAASVLGDGVQKTTSWSLGLAKDTAKSELSNLGGELTHFGLVDIDSHLKDDERSAIMDFLRGTIRSRTGKQEASDAPDIDGYMAIGKGVSNGNINAAIQFMGGSAFLPVNGSTGVYLYLNEDTHQIEGFMATIKWKLN